MSDLGRLSYYLGLEVLQHDGGITLNQKRYALKVLEEVGMKDCNPLHISMDSGLKLEKSEGEKDIDATGRFESIYSEPKGVTWERNETMLKKQDTVALSSCEAEFMVGTEAVRQAMWLQDLLYEVIGILFAKTVIRIDNRSVIALMKNPVFHGHSLLEAEHVPDTEQKANILTKALAWIKYKEMRELIGVHDVDKRNFKFKKEIVKVSLSEKLL
ncbi:uncharacterized protein LOC108820077 [Raphanus sativus]|uniref:Uncharacterized protein LOC108820077 n=1 Tax=Raphanus sativus TaxID=3726 RepID=A0A6J0KKS5_RAPSA|nr:uncharacterized protein LOC108820077 [Raphanus sativus]